MLAKAACTIACTWTDIDGNGFTLPVRGGTATGLAALNGALPVSDGLASGTEIDLSPQGIVTAATYVHILNATGQELNMAWGGNWFPHLPDGGQLIWLFPTAPLAGAVTSLRFMLTQTQSGLGYIKYRMLGT